MKSWSLIFSITVFFFFTGVFANPEVRTFENQLEPFTSDGCSMVKDGTWGTKKRLWQNCCIDHDLAYWQGGTKEQKKNADQQLRQCISAKTESPGLGRAFYWGVSAGGTPRSFFSWRWGYGWYGQRGYIPLSARHLEQVDFLLDDLSLPIPVQSKKIFYVKKIKII